MKKLSTILVLALSFVMMASCASQNLTKEQKMAQKSIKKEVRQLKKDGWKVAPGNIALDMQLKESYNKALELDEKGYEKFVRLNLGTNRATLLEALERMRKALS